MKKLIISGAIFSAFTAFAASNAFADPDNYVHMPNVEYGEKEIDFKLGTAKDVNGERTSAASLGFGYSPTQRWATELYVRYNREGDNGTRFDAFEWENKFLLTEIERPQDRAEGYEFNFGRLLQTEFGKTQLNANLLFARHYRSDEPSDMEMS
jgi:hypothetical protein